MSLDLSQVRELRKLFVKRAAFYDGQLTEVEFFGPEEVLKARTQEHQAAIDTMLSTDEAEPTPEMQKLKDAMGRATTAEERTYFEMEYEKLRQAQITLWSA
jgi:hypothetical protein